MASDLRDEEFPLLAALACPGPSHSTRHSGELESAHLPPLGSTASCSVPSATYLPLSELRGMPTFANPFLERTRILSGIQFTTYFIENFVMETKRFVGSFVHVILYSANLRPALERGCGKQTPSDRKLFSRANLVYVPNIKM